MTEEEKEIKEVIDNECRRTRRCWYIADPELNQKCSLCERNNVLTHELYLNLYQPGPSDLREKLQHHIEQIIRYVYTCGGEPKPESWFKDNALAIYSLIVQAGWRRLK